MLNSGQHSKWDSNEWRKPGCWALWEKPGNGALMTELPGMLISTRGDGEMSFYSWKYRQVCQVYKEIKGNFVLCSVFARSLMSIWGTTELGSMKAGYSGQLISFGELGKWISVMTLRCTGL